MKKVTVKFLDIMENNQRKHNREHLLGTGESNQANKER